VSNFEGLTESQINKLKELQADGHEIGFHGMYHTDAAEYLKNHTVQEYLNYEIIPGIDLMKNKGFNPVDFAYPFGSESSSLTVPLHQYFLHVRGIAKISDSDLIYYQLGSTKTHIYGAEIDEVSNAPLKDITDAILKAKEKNTILILYAHKPVKTNPVEYQITYDKIEKILKNVSDNNMKFYKISELN
jgi:peptidoglycan/xylan/chitin deacetylase (PgdA/CDA1 family)